MSRALYRSAASRTCWNWSRGVAIHRVTGLPVEEGRQRGIAPRHQRLHDLHLFGGHDGEALQGDPSVLDRTFGDHVPERFDSEEVLRKRVQEQEYRVDHRDSRHVDPGRDEMARDQSLDSLP